MATLTSKLKILLPKAKNTGVSFTPTFSPSNSAQVLSVPQYRDHLTDIFDSRQIQDSRTLLKSLFTQDPDISAAVNSYLTVADTPFIALARDAEGQVDEKGQQILQSVLQSLTIRYDYSKGFLRKPGISELAERYRYMMLLRGSIGSELVMSKELFPSEIRSIDTSTLEWFEKTAGMMVPQQTISGKTVSLDIPTFFYNTFRQDPTSAYTNSVFVSSINTIAARQQVINDLYRIMKVTGYPRMDVVIMEDVLLRSAPASVKSDPAKLDAYIRSRLTGISNSISSMRPDQAFVHSDSTTASMLNEKNPGLGIDINSIIDVLNGQNQAALKVMGTLIGRGESGVNTASVEARIFAMNADGLNSPIADHFSDILTLAVRFHGFDGYVDCSFAKAELRSELEQEPNRVMKQSRLLTALSLGTITDTEFHLEMYGRLPPTGTPKLSGTNFESSGPEVSVDKLSPNQDPLGRAITSPDAKQAKSSTVKKS